MIACNVKGCRQAATLIVRVRQGRVVDPVDVCEGHALELRREGLVVEDGPSPMVRRAVMLPGVCAIEGCSAKPKGRGLCNRHHSAAWRAKRLDELAAPPPRVGDAATAGHEGARSASGAPGTVNSADRGRVGGAPAPAHVAATTELQQAPTVGEGERQVAARTLSTGAPSPSTPAVGVVAPPTEEVEVACLAPAPRVPSPGDAQGETGGDVPPVVADAITVDGAPSTTSTVPDGVSPSSSPEVVGDGEGAPDHGDPAPSGGLEPPPDTSGAPRGHGMVGAAGNEDDASNDGSEATRPAAVVRGAHRPRPAAPTAGLGRPRLGRPLGGHRGGHRGRRLVRRNCDAGPGAAPHPAQSWCGSGKRTNRRRRIMIACNVKGCRQAATLIVRVRQGRVVDPVDVCEGHALELRREGLVVEDGPSPMVRRAVMLPGVCAIEGCSAKPKGRGLCNRHHSAAWRAKRLDELAAPPPRVGDAATAGHEGARSASGAPGTVNSADRGRVGGAPAPAHVAATTELQQAPTVGEGERQVAARTLSTGAPSPSTPAVGVVAPPTEEVEVACLAPAPRVPSPGDAQGETGGDVPPVVADAITVDGAPSTTSTVPDGVSPSSSPEVVGDGEGAPDHGDPAPSGGLEPPPDTSGAPRGHGMVGAAGNEDDASNDGSEATRPGARGPLPLSNSHQEAKPTWASVAPPPSCVGAPTGPEGDVDAPADIAQALLERAAEVERMLSARLEELRVVESLVAQASDHRVAAAQREEVARQLLDEARVRMVEAERLERLARLQLDAVVRLTDLGRSP